VKYASAEAAEEFRTATEAALRDLREAQEASNVRLDALEACAREVSAEG
jgi:hypothetical protein